MEAPWWFAGLALAEIAFVGCFFLWEASSLVLRRMANRMDRGLQALAPRQYFDWFGLPLVITVAGALIGSGIGLVVAGGPSGYAGFVIIFVFTYQLGRYLFAGATGALPRPTFQARIRRALAEARERLDVGTPVGPSEATELRDRLRRIEQVGDRLVSRASTRGWRASIRAERLWLVIVTPAAIALPL